MKLRFRDPNTSGIVTLDIPDGPTFFPPKKMQLAEYAKGKNMILVGLPGAFTGT